MTAQTATLARPSLPRLAAVELRKSADTRAGFWLLLVVVLLAAAIVVLQLVFGEDSDRTFSAVLSSAVQVISIVLPVLGILLVTSEWSQRTGLSTFALVPQRERIIVAKTIGAIILTLLAVVACLVVSAIGNAIAGGDWDLGLGELGRYTLFELITMLGGVAFGLAFMNSALAIVMYFVIPIGWSILGETISALDKPADWLDLGRPMTTLADSTVTMSGTDWAQLATASAVWVGVVLAIGLDPAAPHRAQVASPPQPRRRGVCPVRARSSLSSSVSSPPSSPLPRGPAATTAPATACGRRSRARASTSSWPTGSRTGRRPTTSAASPPTAWSRASTRPRAASTTAATSKGLLDRIDYIRGLGTTAIWLTPSFKNKAVQLEDGPSAGYHGYWITDFTQIDPHLGTNADLRALVDAAHARGMKVFFDIITNHTADVIGYEDGARQAVRVEGRRAVPHSLRRPVRRPRLRRRQLLPAASRTGQLPLHADARRRRDRTSRSRPGSTTSRSTTTAATRRSSARTPTTATSSGSTTSSPSTRAWCGA